MANPRPSTMVVLESSGLPADTKASTLRRTPATAATSLRRSMFLVSVAPWENLRFPCEARLGCFLDEAVTLLPIRRLLPGVCYRFATDSVCQSAFRGHDRPL